MGWQIAVDGPAAAGKSTVAKKVAKKIEFIYIDTGSMYRAIAYKAILLNRQLDNENEYSFINDTNISFIEDRVILDGQDVTDFLRSKEVSDGASLCSKFLLVRKHLVSLQQKMASSCDVVMDGRDIASVVLPNADLKIYLDADVNIRAMRRYKEREEKGLTDITFEQILQEQISRDYQDMNRENSPLIKVKDAIILDTTKLTIEDCVEYIINELKKKGWNNMNNEEKQDALLEESEQEEIKEVTLEEEEIKIEDEIAEEEVKSDEEIEFEEELEEANQNQTKSDNRYNKKRRKKKERDPELDTYVKYQLVKGIVEKVEWETQDEKDVDGNIIRKGRPEQVIFKIAGAEHIKGILRRRDAAIDEKYELGDMYTDGDEADLIVLNIRPEVNYLTLSTKLLLERNKLISYEKKVNKDVISAKVIERKNSFYILSDKEAQFFLPVSQTNRKLELDEEVFVMPIKIDIERIKIIVSLTAANQHKFTELTKEIDLDTIYDGKVIKIISKTENKKVMDIGAIVELQNGIQGLLHISQLSHTNVKNVSDVIKEGDEIKVKVIRLDDTRIALSMKALTPIPKVGDIFKGRINEMRKNKRDIYVGAEVIIDNSISAFLPKGEYSWDRTRILEHELNTDDEIEVKVIEVRKGHDVIVSAKKVGDNPWDNLPFKEGDKVNLPVKESLNDGYLLDAGTLTLYVPRYPQMKYRVGEMVPVVIKDINREIQKIFVRYDNPNFVTPPRAEFEPRKNKDRSKFERNDSYEKNKDEDIRIGNTFGDFFKKEGK